MNIVIKICSKTVSRVIGGHQNKSNKIKELSNWRTLEQKQQTQIINDKIEKGDLYFKQVCIYLLLCNVLMRPICKSSKFEPNKVHYNFESIKALTNLSSVRLWQI
jgi:hypothetical protein